MNVTSGARIGPYEIVAPLGAGGMGEVYRARDLKLNRDVAIKLLLPAVATDPERLARFRREAQILASLNHPNIGHIYGFIEGADGVGALVLELVEGPTLAERIAQGPLPLDEALAIARQVAEALEAAHDQGIVHRDLKPANIKIRADGTVKVLDFGLAKAIEGERPGDPALSPTLTAATVLGVILGTAAYMAPEQAKGRPIDKRADSWAFGCVVYEMLTGVRAFDGEDVSDTLAFVLTKEPDWSLLPANTPLPIRRLLRRCLQKDRARRLADVADARLEIEDARTESEPAAQHSVGRPDRQFDWRRLLPWAVAAALAAALGFLVLWPVLWRRPASAGPLVLNAELGADITLANLFFGDVIALSPDGAVIAFVGEKTSAGGVQLYVRRLTQLQAMPVSGTDNASSPFFSPDGQWIGFFSSGKLKKVAVFGGAAVTLCDAPMGRGGSWAEDGTIVFSPNTGQGVPLMRTSSAGGKAEPLTSIGEREMAQRWPQILPGDKAVLYTSSTSLGAADDGDIVVQPLPSGLPTIVHRGGYHGRYLASGHLVYIRAGTLFAAPFDLDRLELTGPPVPAVEGVMSSPVNGSGQFTASTAGTLAYLPGQSGEGELPMMWMGPDGKLAPLRPMPSNWSNVRFSPDGRRIAFDIRTDQRDVWIYDLERGTSTRLTFNTSDDFAPAWTPDGRGIVFASTRGDKSVSNLYWQRADGTGEPRRLTESGNQQHPISWHPSGNLLAFMEQLPKTGYDVMLLPIDNTDPSGPTGGQPTAFLRTKAAELAPMFSPDGRWIAYTSTESGRGEVYVRPFPGPGGQQQISTGGGGYATWSRARHELFYNENGRIMVAAYAVEGDAFRAEQPRPWSDGRFAVRAGPNRMYDVHPDGDRFALAPVPTAAASKPDKVVFIFNFFDELRRIAPVRR